ncbi:MAG: transglutaminase domain-containing protein [Bacillota bacterium]|nr:transglutaminase domain-containing protein [Bacillota bacterium]
MKRGKKGLGLSRLLVILLVVLFGSSAFAMQQMQLFSFGTAEPGVPMEYKAAVRVTEQDVLGADVLPLAKVIREEVKPETEEQTEEKTEEKNEAAAKQPQTANNQNNRSSSTVPTVRKNTATAPAVTPVPVAEPDKLQQAPAAQPEQQTEADKPETVNETSETVKEPAEEPVEEKVEEKQTPANPYRWLSSRNHNVLTKLVVKNTGEEISSNVRIEVPLITSSSLYFARSGETFSITPEIKTVNGTRVGVFSLGNIEPGEETVVEIRTQSRTTNIQFYADYVPTDGKMISSYLGTATGIETTNSQIVSLSNKLTQGMSSDWEKARAITQWVSTNIKYDANAANRNQGALTALETRKGVCEDYAKLSTALGRAAGIPTRVVYGYTDNGSKWTTSSSLGLNGYRHAWVEYYLYGRGWVPAEPTRSHSSSLYFGTLPHNRYIVQNYNNISLRGNYSGGKLSINWVESLY